MLFKSSFLLVTLCKGMRYRKKSNVSEMKIMLIMCLENGGGSSFAFLRFEASVRLGTYQERIRFHRQSVAPANAIALKALPRNREHAVRKVAALLSPCALALSRVDQSGNGGRRSSFGCAARN